MCVCIYIYLLWFIVFFSFFFSFVCLGMDISHCRLLFLVMAIIIIMPTAPGVCSRCVCVMSRHFHFH